MREVYSECMYRTSMPDAYAMPMRAGSPSGSGSGSRDGGCDVTRRDEMGRREEICGEIERKRDREMKGADGQR